jgi:predicted dehydrogenase
MNSKIEFGIVCAGFFADVVASALKDTEAKLVAVASRRRESADAFTDK